MGNPSVYDHSVDSMDKMCNKHNKNNKYPKMSLNFHLDILLVMVILNAQTTIVIKYIMLGVFAIAANGLN